MTGSWKAIQRNIRRYLPRITQRSSSPRVDQPTVHNDSIFKCQSQPPPAAPPPKKRRSPPSRRPAHRHAQARRFLIAGLGITLLTLSLRGLGLLHWVELDVYDLMLRRRPTPPMPPIVLVGFEESFVARPHAWPITDAALAQLLQTIADAEPVAIGLDIYRDVPVGQGEAALTQLYKTLPNLYGIQRMGDKQAAGVRPPEVLARRNQVGFNNVVLDADGRLRRSVLYWWQDGKGYQSLSLKLAEHYLRQNDIYTTLDGQNPDQVNLGQATFLPLERNSGNYHNEDTAGYQILADFHGGRGTIPVISAQEILDGQVDPAALANRIVLVGVIADSVKDSFHTSYTNTIFSPQKSIFGVEVQAQLVAQLISAARGDRPVLTYWSEGAEILWILAWCLGGTLLGMVSRYPIHGILWGMISAAELVVVSYISLLGGWWIPVIPPLVGGGSALVIVILLNAQQHYELQRSKDFLHSVIAAVPEPVFVQDSDYRWVVLNPAFEELVGYPLSQLMNQPPEAVLPPSSAAVFQDLDRNLSPRSKPKAHQATFWRGDRRVDVILKRSLHCDRAGNCFLVGSLQDITAQKRLEERLNQRATELRRHNEQLQRSQQMLHHQATHDPLTGLGNRQFLDRELTRLLQDTNTQDTNTKEELLSVLFLDLDGFKAVNDECGHQAGDEILIQTAQRLLKILRGGDVVARLGGDEFVVVLPGIPYREVAERVSRKIIRAIADPFKLKGDRLSPLSDPHPPHHNGSPHRRKKAAITAVTVSIGIAFSPQDATTPDHLIAAADHAMLSAKRKGKNNHQYYADLSPIDLGQSRHSIADPSPH